MAGHEENMDPFGVYGEMIDGVRQEVADALDRLSAKYLMESEAQK